MSYDDESIEEQSFKSDEDIDDTLDTLEEANDFRFDDEDEDDDPDKDF